MFFHVDMFANSHRGLSSLKDGSKFCSFVTFENESDNHWAGLLRMFAIKSSSCGTRQNYI